MHDCPSLVKLQKKKQVLGYDDSRPASKTQVCILTRGPVVEPGVEVAVQEKAAGTRTVS